MPAERLCPGSCRRGFQSRELTRWTIGPLPCVLVARKALNVGGSGSVGTGGDEEAGAGGEAGSDQAVHTAWSAAAGEEAPLGVEDLAVESSLGG